MTLERRIHIIHVGSVTNKGTYALLKSEMGELSRLYESLEISVSTTDLDSLRRLEPTLVICPPLVDIPFEKADAETRRNGLGREAFIYKFYLATYTLLMFLQPFLSIISSAFEKVGVPAYRHETIRRIMNSDMVISTADENFKEGSSNLPFNIYWRMIWWSMLFARMWDLIITKRIFKKPVVVFPNSVGPFRTRIGRFMARMALNNADFVMLRESYSYKSLKELGTNTASVITSDIVLLLENTPIHLTESLSRPVIGVSPGYYAASFPEEKQQEYVSTLSAVLDRMIEENGVDVVFLPHAVSGLKGDDLSVCEIVLQNMLHKDRARIIHTEMLEDFKAYLGQLDLLVSSRMHPAVLACSAKVPVVVIFYDYKQTGFLSQLGLGRFAIDINHLSFEELLLKMEFALKDRQNIKEQLEIRIPILQNDLRAKIESVCATYLPR